MNIIRLQLFLILFLVLAACSSEKNTFTNRLYHNTTSKYNALYYANAKILELEENIRLNHREDYSQVLPVFYPVDSAMIEDNEANLIEIKEFSSKAIDWHRISKHVDDGYFLIGMADYYDARFDDAMNTFKYLNVNSKRKSVRHRSLIQLMRAFTDLGNFDDAAYVVDFLSKESGISKDNKFLLYKTLAYYYEKRGEVNLQVGALDMALKYTSDKKEKSRINFILGQLYQSVDIDAMAYNYYREAQKGNPPYERSFFSQLYAQQVAELNKSKDVDKVRGFFDNLYKDSKNSELKDIILYEKAIFELKQEEVDNAVELLIRAAKEESNNQIQKGYIYKKLGEISFDTKKDFRAAKYYYDSALSNFRPNDTPYALIVSKKETLDKYVLHYQTIQNNDSLLRISALSPEDQELIAEAFIKQEEDRLLREAAIKNAPKNTGIFDNLLAFGGKGSGETFYFNNALAQQQGTIDFYRNWGNRPLQDNWRRNVQSVQSSALTQRQAAPNVTSDSVGEQEENALFSDLPNKENLLAQIPKTDAELSKFKMDLELSYFELGRLLFFDLKESELSIDYLENLITTYPNTGKKPEAYYILYLANKEIGGNAAAYANLLSREFPDSPFTFSVINPDRTSGNQAYMESSKKYKEAYQLYYGKQYQQSRELIRNTLENYPLTRNTDKLLLLDVMVSGKLDDKERYKSRLENFIQTTEDQDLDRVARNMLIALTGENPVKADTTEEAENYQAMTGEDSLTTDDQAEGEEELDQPYKENPNQTHIFVIALDADKAREAKNLLADLEVFHSQNFASSRLRTGNMNMNREQVIFIISPFSNSERALAYRKKFTEGFVSQSITDEQKGESFLISIENFQELNRRKNLEEYRRFYKNTY